MPDVSLRDITMQDYRSAKKAKEDQKSSGSLYSRYFPFYGQGFGQTSLIRLLPDLDEDNITATVELHEIKLPFGGLINSENDSLDDHVATVPCMTTWGEKDATQEDIRPHWNGSDADKDIARTYYRKVSTLMSGLVISTPVVEKQPPQSPIRAFKFGKQVAGVIDAAYMDDEFEYAPHSFTHGRDFALTKTQQGNFANYGTSKFKSKERPLTDDELAVIEKCGLINLVDLLGKKPDAAMQAVIWEMYQASRNGDPFDNARWGAHFRAFKAGGFNQPATTTPAPATVSPAERAATKERNASNINKLRNRVTSTTAA